MLMTYVMEYRMPDGTNGEVLLGPSFYILIDFHFFRLRFIVTKEKDIDKFHILFEFIILYQCDVP